MSTLEIKKRLIKKIRKIENEDLLKDVNRLIDLESSDEDVYMLNEEEEQAVSEAEEQIKSGRVLNDEDAKKDIAEWLKK
ncbi:MAG: hypothetical protein ACTHK8_04990 [Ginsengibacter sp.]